MNPNWTESHNKRITLQEPSQCCNVFGDFLSYLYTGTILYKLHTLRSNFIYNVSGRIQISHATVMPVMALADKYNVLDLMSLCKTFMIENIPSASRCNQLMNWLQVLVDVIFTKIFYNFGFGCIFLQYSFACGHQQLANACR
jgi:hypothetical protein